MDKTNLILNNFQALKGDKKVLICIGPGGVGKTSISASLALYSSILGHKSLVMTIDPAKRLANALGLSHLKSLPEQVDLSQISPMFFNTNLAQDFFAMMLDMSFEFEQMIMESGKKLDFESLKNNRFYQAMSQSLSGIHEYMAVYKLDELLKKKQFEFLVLDTPPTRHALDFLNAPTRFLRFFDQESLKWLLKSGGAFGKIGLKFFDLGGQFLTQTLSRVGGVDILKNIAEFLVHFEPLFSSFKEKAKFIEELLLSDKIGYVIITAPKSAQVNEALSLYDELSRHKKKPQAVIINRVQYHSKETQILNVNRQKWLEFFSLEKTKIPSIAKTSEELTDEVMKFWQNYQHRRQDEEMQIDKIKQKIDKSVLVLEASELEEDIHSISGLMSLGERLFSKPSM